MANPLANKHIILGITGSIAAYKSAELASRLSQMGATVNTIFTEAGLKFIRPLTLQSVTGNKAFADMDLWGGEGHVVHIQIGHSTDFLVIAPATANTISKLANGIADNLLTVTALAAACPVLIAPAMDAGMYNHPATQQNITILKERGVYFIGPVEGHLASGLTGPGRMEEPQIIINELRWIISRSGPLKGKKIIVTAGGTREAFDPVRYISNRSSGKQGYAIAQAAMDAGADATLISAPTNLIPPRGVHLIPIENAEQMSTAVLDQVHLADALIMAAAVADFKPQTFQKQKIKKTDFNGEFKFSRTVDILTEVAKIKQTKNLRVKIIGFAAESENLHANARKKLMEKQLDLIIANDITEPNSGFGADTNRVHLIYSDGSTEEFPLLPKTEIAEKIIQHLISWLTEGAG